MGLGREDGISELLHSQSMSLKSFLIGLLPLCLAPIYRRERRFFEICMPSMRLRNDGSNVGPTSLLQMLINNNNYYYNNNRDEERGGRTLLWIGVMGKGKRAIERIERSKNCVKQVQSPPGSSSSPVARCSDGPRPKGRSNERVQVPGRSRKKQAQGSPSAYSP